MNYTLTAKSQRKFRRNRDAIRRAQIVQAIPSYTINGDPLLSPVESGAYIGGVSVSTLAKWRSQYPDRLPHVRVGGRIRYRRSVLDNYLNQQTVTDGRGVSK